MSKKAIKQKAANDKLLNDRLSYIYLLPIIFVITVVPLIVCLKIVEVSQVESKNWYGLPTYTDFFSFYKSQWLIIGTVLAVVFFLVYSIAKGLKIKKDFLYIPVIAYGLLIILSSLNSEFSHVAISGFVARNEGMIALLCYLALMLVTFNLTKSELHLKLVMGALLISAAIIGIIGLFQFFGLDFFRTSLGQRIIMPAEYLSYKINFRFEKSIVISTFSNSNYVGSYMAMLLPVAFIAFIYYKKPLIKAGSGILFVVLLINLFGSRSRAGLAALAFIVLITVIIFRKFIFKRKLLVIGSFVLVVALFAGTNLILKGALVNRILAVFDESSASSSNFFDLKDIKFGDQSVSVMSSTETLTMSTDGVKLYFSDGDGKALDFSSTANDNKQTINISDVRYGNYLLTLQGAYLALNVKGSNIIFKIEPDKFKLVGINGDETNTINKPETLGFEGQERLGSARGYIWSRTLPMIKNSALLGSGPDTFALKFPQNDYIGKIRAYGDARMIVDKPHDIYLQIAANTGVPSLIVLILLWGYYIIQSIKVYFRKFDNSLIYLFGAAIFIGVIGYLTAGFFNDSVVSVAPVFWVLLGLGFVCNKTLLATKTGLVGIKK